MSTRLVPHRAFPPYAYLPGRHPHPVRDADGHSFGIDAVDDPRGLDWAVDLFDAGYYWEAHEAWEPLWRAARRGSAERAVLKALILVAAAGLKLREGKPVAGLRHATRALDGLHAVPFASDAVLFIEAARLLGACIRSVPWSATSPRPLPAANPVPVFDFSVQTVVKSAWFLHERQHYQMCCDQTRQ